MLWIFKGVFRLSHCQLIASFLVFLNSSIEFLMNSEEMEASLSISHVSVPSRCLPQTDWGKSKTFFFQTSKRTAKTSETGSPNQPKNKQRKWFYFCSPSTMTEQLLKSPLTISSRCAYNLYFLNEGLPEMGLLKLDVASHLGPFVLPPALWLHGKRAAHPAAVHRDRRRPPPATTCLLPGSPHHRQNRLNRQPWSNAIQHQNFGDPSASWKQHEGHVSTLRPPHVAYPSFSFHNIL